MNLPGLFRLPTQTSGRPTLPTPRNRSWSSLPFPLSQRLSTFYFPKGFGEPQFLSPARVGKMMLRLLQLLRAACRTRTVPCDAEVRAPHAMGCAGREGGAPRWICRFVSSGHRLSPGGTNRDVGERDLLFIYKVSFPSWRCSQFTQGLCKQACHVV